MDYTLEGFKNGLKNLSDKINLNKEDITTEEGTKNAFVLPFLSLLGYDVFNPKEVNPEYIRDIGIKKGEKIDYAVFNNGTLFFLVECKLWSKNLDLYESQLLRYFHVSNTRFGILTNGIEYRFYSDLDLPNKMDEKPFLKFSITDLDDVCIKEIYNFHKDKFDLSLILQAASNLKYQNNLKDIISKEMRNPSDELIKYFLSKVYSGRITEKTVENFREMIRKTLQGHVIDLLNSYLKNVFDKGLDSVTQDESQVEENITKIIETTEQELYGFAIIKSLLKNNIDLKRISYKDTLSYFGIFFDNNNKKPLYRLYFTENKLTIGIINSERQEIKYVLSDIEDLYNYGNELKNSLSLYL